MFWEKRRKNINSLISIDSMRLSCATMMKCAYSFVHYTIKGKPTIYITLDIITYR